MTSVTDVLVVGAGPTGLVAAAELARRGIACRIVDRQLERSDRSRALVVQPRTLEVLQSMGASGDLLELGQRSLSLNIHLEGRPVASAQVGDLGFEGTPFPFLLFVSQAETERVLEQHAARIGVQVERGMELVSLRERDEQVEAELTTAAGVQIVRARYVIGADGAHSAVRTLAGLRFEGDAYPQDFALADVDVDWPYGHGGVHLFFSRAGVFACLPMRGERAYRFVMVRSKGGDEAGDPTLDEVRERAKTATNLDLCIENPRWLARFRLHHRGVDRYRRGRIFVAGDAAHIHSPAGGQGMNTGIQDAFNLAWKLALVIQGRAADALLDSYHAERHPIGQNLLRFTDRLFRIGSSDSWLLAQVRRGVIPLAAPFVLKNPRRLARLVDFISQLGIRYDFGPLAEEPRRRGSLRKRPAAGFRAPDAQLGRTTLFEQMRGTRFHLLRFSARGHDPGAERDALGMNELVTTLRIRRDPAGAESSLLDTDGQAFRRYGVTDAALYLVRPDGYIATRTEGDDIAKIRGYLQRHLL